jgi:hypothetical protein
MLRKLKMMEFLISMILRAISWTQKLKKAVPTNQSKAQSLAR